MKSKYKVMLLVISVLLTMSLLMSFSYAYIGKSNLSNNIYNTNFNLPSSRPYNLRLANSASPSVTLNYNLFTTGNIGNEVFNTYSNMNIVLSGTKKYTTCYYNLYFEALSDFNMTTTNETEFTITVKKSGSVVVDKLKMNSMTTGEKKYLLYDTSIIAGVGSTTTQSINVYYGFYSIDADQTKFTNQLIKGKIVAEQDYCEVST